VFLASPMAKAQGNLHYHSHYYSILTPSCEPIQSAGSTRI